MAQQILNLGSGPDTQDGDQLRPAMAKVQANFDELYSKMAPSVRDFGAKADGSPDNAAFTAMASTAGFIRVPAGSYTLNNISISVPIFFEPGSSITVPPGQTVTISSVIGSDRQHIFKGEGGVNVSNGTPDVVYPEWWGAAGDGVANDTVALQAALNAIANGGTVLLGNLRIYAVTNLITPNRNAYSPGEIIPYQWIKSDGRSVIKAIAGGDTAYMVSEPNWVNDAAFETRGWGFEGVVFDGNGIVDNTVIGRYYWSRSFMCHFRGGNVSNFTITRQSKGGTSNSPSTLGNNKILYCSFYGSGQYNFRTQGTTSNPLAGPTDGWFVGNELFANGADYNVELATATGWIIQENHPFGSAPGTIADFRFLKLERVGAFSGNICENKVIIERVSDGTSPMVLGPGNEYWRDVIVGFRDDDTVERLIINGDKFTSSPPQSEVAQITTDTNRNNKTCQVANATFLNSSPKTQSGSGGAITIHNSFIAGAFNASA